jgi:hypothetical protein
MQWNVLAEALFDPHHGLQADGDLVLGTASLDGA